MKEIGGYFELELNTQKNFLHANGMLVNSGRNALEYILLSLGDVEKVWLPYFTCEVVLEPLEKLGINYAFYPINQNLELSGLINLKQGEYLLYTNYFGIKDEYVKFLVSVYGRFLIVDNAQSYYSEPYKGVSTFYSPRKFFGIPDGGIAVCENEIAEIEYPEDVSFDRCLHLLKRYDVGPQEGYTDFKRNSAKLSGEPIKKMSRLTRNLMKSIDYEGVKFRRRENFRFIHDGLGKMNMLDFPDIGSFECPMIYPFLVGNGDSLKKKLIQESIYVATYWPNVFYWRGENTWEYNLANKMIAIPIDQRYCIEEMEKIIKNIKSF